MLEIINLNKKYGEKKGVFNFTLNCDKGSIVGFIGPNGSGKTTLFKTIAGLLIKDSGNVFFNKENINKIDVTKIAYLDETPYLLEELTPLFFLEYVNVIKGLKCSRKEIEEMLSFWGLEKIKNDAIKGFLLGMRKRVALAAVFIGKPELIILDEPTNGLDTQNIIRLKYLIRKRQEEGALIILSNHVVDFVKDVCERVVFISKGEKILDFKVEGVGIDIDKVYMQCFMEGEEGLLE